jgi:hypothetical protein
MFSQHKTTGATMAIERETETVEVTRRCGHTSTVTITKYKKPGNRARKIEYLESNLCGPCFIELAIREYGLVPLRMSYSQFKRRYYGAVCDYDSYDAKDKTITVYVRKEHLQDADLKKKLASDLGLNDGQARFLIEQCHSGANRWLIHDLLCLDFDSEQLESAFEIIEANDPGYQYAPPSVRQRPEIEDILNDDIFYDFYEGSLAESSTVVDESQMEARMDYPEQYQHCKVDNDYLEEKTDRCDECVVEGCPWSLFLEGQEQIF